MGIVGDPVGHSLSPRMHNAAFLEADVPGIYLKFQVEAVELEDFFQVAVDYGLRGFNVTIPHKEAILLAGQDWPQRQCRSARSTPC